MASMYQSSATGAPVVSGPVRSGVSIVAILAAVGSFYFSSHGQEFVALIMAFVAIAAGLLGGLRALSPRVSGGMLSIAAVVMGVIAVLVALLALFV